MKRLSLFVLVFLVLGIFTVSASFSTVSIVSIISALCLGAWNPAGAKVPLMLTDSLTGTTVNYPMGVAAAGGRVYFSAVDPVHGCEPWVTDGTPEGTRLSPCAWRATP